MRRYFFYLCFYGLFTACLKDTANTYEPGALVRVALMFNDSGYFAINNVNVALKQDSLLAPSLSYYSEFMPKNNQLEVIAKLNGTGTTSIYNSNINIEAEKYYTLYIGKNSNGNYTTLFSEDSITLYQANASYIRFLNAMPGQTFDFYVDTVKHPLSKPYFLNDRNISSYRYNKSGIYNFEVRLKDSSWAIKQIQGLELKAGKNYTFIVSGNDTTQNFNQVKFVYNEE